MFHCMCFISSHIDDDVKREGNKWVGYWKREKCVQKITTAIKKSKLYSLLCP